jgi:hypothetical protein
MLRPPGLIARGEFQRLHDILVFEFLVFRLKFRALCIKRDSRQYAPDRQPHCADARLPIHDF